MFAPLTARPKPSRAPVPTGRAHALPEPAPRRPGPAWSYADVVTSAPPSVAAAPQAAVPQAVAPQAMPQLVVSGADEPFEREADRLASRIAAAPDAALQPLRAPSVTGGRAEAPPIVGEALRAPGRPLDAATRTFAERRLGHDLGAVRIHADGPAAASAAALDAQAFTVGDDVSFAAGRYAPATSEGRGLLVHELVHVVQNARGGPAARGLVARQPQTWGTAKTTAPPAQNQSPGDVFRKELTDEVALFANAGAIADWIVAERAAAGGATVTDFTTDRLFADTALVKKLKPVPQTAAELLPALDMLEFYEVVRRKGPGEWTIGLAPLQPGQAQQDVNRADFDAKRTDIAAFRTSFEKRFDAKGRPIAQIAQPELLAGSLAAGAASELKDERDAKTGLAAVTAELDEFVAFRKAGAPVFRVTGDSPARVTAKGKMSVLLEVAGRTSPLPVDEADFDRIEPVRTGTDPQVQARRTAIEARVQRATRALFNAQSFHRFATEMVWFLGQLDATSSIHFKAGTYPRHGKFGEYAADLFPVIAEDARGFYKPADAERFVDAINAVAEAGNPYWGKFAWQIVYNDTALQTTINAKYGGRMTSAPHHGPAPDKLHMHLDIRPLDVVADTETGFGMNASGRVVLY